jgi:CRISPR-associated endoribonuclease Cas6
LRVKIVLDGINNSLVLPIDYNYIIQGFIYNNISFELSSFLHQKGYIHGKRTFKLFNFSRLFGRFDMAKGSIIFKPPVYLYIASSDGRFIKEFAESLIKDGKKEIAGQPVMVNSIEVYPNLKFNRVTGIRTLAPITVYSTLQTRDGRKKTYYYSPFEDEFSKLIEENLKKKFKVIHHKEPNRRSLTVTPLKRISEKIVKYKGTVMKGWMGEFKLEGSPTLMSIAYDTGLGSKNSQGFGMFEVVNRSKNA